MGLAGSQGEEKWDAAANPKGETTHLTLPKGFATNRAVSPSSTLYVCQLWLVDTFYPLLHTFSSKRITLQLLEHPGSF